VGVLVLCRSKGDALGAVRVGTLAQDPERRILTNCGLDPVGESLVHLAIERLVTSFLHRERRQLHRVG
jgi:hypothetical protein